MENYFFKRHCEEPLGDGAISVGLLHEIALFQGVRAVYEGTY